MPTNPLPNVQLKDPEFWEKMERAARKVDDWPDWKKDFWVNKREAVGGTQAVTEDTDALKS